MSFLNVRLPEEVEKGANGGPSFLTTISTLASGFEKRNINWSAARQQFDVGYGIQSKEHFSEVLSFFYVCNGRAHSFRFKDWGDYQIGDDLEDIPQEIGEGDGLETAFQILKRYEVATSPAPTIHERDITKPVDGTVRVFVNFVEQTVTVDYTVNYSTGIITFVVAPTLGESVGVICEFDVAVRFDVDQCEVTLETFQAGAVPNLPVVEVRGE